MEQQHWCDVASTKTCESSLSGPIRESHGQTVLPILRGPNYFSIPSIDALAALEHTEPGFCSRVESFVIGCEGYGSIKFFGCTDVRWLDLDSIVHFRHQEVIVYPDENTKPWIGYGLNKPAEVTLLRVQCRGKESGEDVITKVPEAERFVEKLKKKTEAQGAKFISYDIGKQEWRFQVEHFSRFGLDDSDEDNEPMDDTQASPILDAEAAHDIVLDDVGKAPGKMVYWQHERSEDGSEEMEAEGSPMEDPRFDSSQSALAHSLPQHLRLDPLKMQQMKMLFFSSEEEVGISNVPNVSSKKSFRSKNKPRSPGTTNTATLVKTPSSKIGLPPTEDDSPKSLIFSKHIMKVSPQASWKHLSSLSPSSRDRHLSLQSDQGGLAMKHPRMLLSLDRKNEISSLKRPKVGFEVTLDSKSCMYGRSGDVVDAALFLGCSFRVGWGPHGLLVHSGNPVGVEGSTLSSIVHVEKVALDACVRDKEGKVRDELMELQFIYPLNLHMSLSKVVDGMDEQAANIRLRYVHCSRYELSDICDKYEDLLVRQHSIEGLSSSQLLILRHQVMTWHLLSVLFSEKSVIGKHPVAESEDPESFDDVNAFSPGLEPRLTPLLRRADFSRWLQDSVRLVIQEEMRDLESQDHLKVLFSHLTGRQLDEGVQVAALRGDVRLACLVSQAGSSMVARKDIAHQLEVWEKEGLDFSLIESDMILLYKLLSGDVQGALQGRLIDWKRFMGMLMWYHLAPETHITGIIRQYSLLIEQHAAPIPVPMYKEEALLHDLSSGGPIQYDTAYYLMLLYASEGQKTVNVPKMFSSFSSTDDPLDHRMAWLQHKILESIEALTPTQMHVLDMNFMSQLLSVGECHWALYVALHMPPSVDYPSLHERVVKEVLNQYCEVWSTNEIQQTFIEKELGVPADWLHEALGTYWQYIGDKHKAIIYLVQSKQWQRAHFLLMISVAATLFLAGEYEELLGIATSLEKHKMELADWQLSGGIYADFFLLRSSFQHANNSAKVEDDFASKTMACKLFFQRLKESQVLWEGQWEPSNRVVYSRMAHGLATLLLAESKAKMLPEVSSELKLYDIVMDAPVPEDDRFCRLQGAAASFTSWLLQTVPR